MTRTLGLDRFRPGRPRFLREDAGHALRAGLTDRGGEFSGAFHRACETLAIQHGRTNPRHSWTNGFVERPEGTILSEFWRFAFRRTYYTALGRLERNLQAYLRFYNREQSHLVYPLKNRAVTAWRR